jgi:hypothetical protein
MTYRSDAKLRTLRRPGVFYYHREMSFTVVEFESTPNPNAVKCWLDRPISDGPRSFLSVDMAKDDPIALALFKDAGATTVLFNGDWLTVNKTPSAAWSTVKSKVKRILAEATV